MNRRARSGAARVGARAYLSLNDSIGSVTE